MTQPTNTINRPRTTTRATIEVPNISMHELLARSRTTVEIDREQLAELAASCASDSSPAMTPSEQLCRLAMTCSDGIDASCEQLARPVRPTPRITVNVAAIIRVADELGIPLRVDGKSLRIGEADVWIPRAQLDDVREIHVRTAGAWRTVNVRTLDDVAAFVYAVAP